MDVVLVWTAAGVQSDNRTVGLVITTTMTSLQGLAERRQRSSRQTAGLHGAARRTKRAGCRIETARTTGDGGNTLRVPVGRFSAGFGSSVPDKLRLPRGSEMKIWRRLSDMASCLISANQDERKTTPKLA
ncbi:hypothetical protein PFLUV_G00107130 [Perca fluviatilis]|uniref:Uncharacterized protein n=1 Tax=Perca fluviatilis TaxID=8168 RepID=A0A6A5F1S4_PERFL|nr:hypothetical protein PFLUV_G00107130 [Perca fluviatilis]